MATTTEINAMADIMADETTDARNSIPTSWYPMDKLPLVTAHMKKAEARALNDILDIPWQGVMAYNSSNVPDDRATLGQGWFNRGGGWAVAATRRNSLQGYAELRGVIYNNAINTDPILQLQEYLAPAQNEIFNVMIGTPGQMVAAPLRIYTDGTVALWDITTVTSAQYLSLSGIRFEVVV